MGRRRRKSSIEIEPSEKAIQSAVITHWVMLGVPGSLVAAIPNAFAHGQSGLTPGLPDLIVLSPQLGTVTGYIELKGARGRASNAQTRLGKLLQGLGVPYALTHGRDEPIEILEQWGAVRRRSLVERERTAGAVPGVSGAEAAWPPF